MEKSATVNTVTLLENAITKILKDDSNFSDLSFGTLNSEENLHSFLKRIEISPKVK